MIKFKDSSLTKWNNDCQSGPYKEGMSKDEDRYDYDQDQSCLLYTSDAADD